MLFNDGLPKEDASLENCRFIKSDLKFVRFLITLNLIIIKEKEALLIKEFVYFE
jgi:hypothetical protein